MQAKQRYILLFLSCAFLALCYFGGYRLKGILPDRGRHWPPLDSYMEREEIMEHRSFWSLPPKQRQEEAKVTTLREQCRMETCFDFSKCASGFKVYVHPVEETVAMSSTYRKILNVLTESRYHTTDASQACLFILGLDTLDRDSLSSDYVRGMQSKLNSLPHWNGGQNHIIFNFYSGTWPDYTEDLGMDIGRAILAKASISVQNYRPSFDISLPLVHKEHLERGGDILPVYAENIPAASKSYLLAFKGKRYVYGIGSETRNSLYHLHNSRDVIMVTTCKHGKSWKELKDDRCEEDNAEYDRYDYEVLLHNATFCLVPRGRRLGSFRFIEVLQAGCIPVLLSNNWVIPFSEIIDWKTSAIWADERLLLQVPDIVRSIEAERVMALRQQSQLLWHMYFSSIDRIIFTTLEIVRQRIHQHLWKDGRVWNSFPGGLVTLPYYTDTPSRLPWNQQQSTSMTLATGGQRNKNASQFTAVIYSQQQAGSPLVPATSSGPLLHLLRVVSRSQHVARIVVVWASDSPKPPPSRWPSLTRGIPLHIVVPQQKQNIGERFRPLDLIETDAVFSLDEDATLTTDEIDFAFHVWRHFPERIVGFPARTHYWDDTKGQWGYTSKWTNEYSMVLTGAAIYHRYYHTLYTDWLGPLLHKTVDQSHNCEDILINFLVSHVTRQPPIKVSQRKQYKSSNLSAVTSRSPWNDPDHFLQRQTCLNTFVALFGYMPLIRSAVRFDPVLFKDPVSNLRKKYRQMELVNN